MDTLILESFSMSPHLETAGEIAITEIAAEVLTGFLFVYSANPDDHRYISKTQREKLLGIGWKTKIHNLENILAKHGVQIIREPVLSQKAYKNIWQFASNFPDTLEEIKVYRYQDAELGLSVASSIIFRTGSYSPNLKLHKNLVQKYLYSSAIVYEKVKLILSKLHPKKIISFNGRLACSKGIFEAARSLDISAYYHERGATHEMYEIFESPPHNAAYIREQVAWYWQHSAIDRNVIAHNFFRKKRAGEGIGWVSFVAEQKKGKVPKRSSKRHIVYYTSSDDEYAAVGNLVQHPIFGDQREAIQFLILWVSQQAESHLTIRVHPHLKYKALEDREWWHALHGRNVEVIEDDSDIDSYALMDWADLVITYGLTSGIEAAYWGKPSLLIGDSLYSGFGCVYEPKTKVELCELLSRQDLEPLPQKFCLPYGYYCLSFGKQYKYYQLYDLFTGAFLGKPLSVEPRWYSSARQLKSNLTQKVGKIGKLS